MNKVAFAGFRGAIAAIAPS